MEADSSITPLRSNECFESVGQVRFISVMYSAICGAAFTKAAARISPLQKNHQGTVRPR